VVVFWGGEELILWFGFKKNKNKIVLVKKNKDLVLFKSLSENYKASSSRRSGGFPKISVPFSRNKPLGWGVCFFKERLTLRALIGPNHKHFFHFIFFHFFSWYPTVVPRQKNKEDKGCVTLWRLALYIKKVSLRQKKELWKLKYFTMQNIIFKKSSKRKTKIHQDIITLLLISSFTTQAKISSFKNPHIKIDLVI
jgi:hypothetical protein